MRDSSIQLDEALEEIRGQEELSNEEVVKSHEEIDAIEYQNALNLERLQDYVTREENWMKKAREREEKEKIIYCKIYRIKEKARIED